MADSRNSPVHAVCMRCGVGYTRYSGFFHVSHALCHKGTGYLPYCKTCIEEMFDSYWGQCRDDKTAVRQMCRKLDIYWNEQAYDLALQKSSPRSIMNQYISTINTAKYAGKSYDDTLIEEETLWIFPKKAEEIITDTDDPFVTPDIVAFWGSGYSASMYKELDRKYRYWMSRCNPDGDELDIGTEALIKQICNLEVSIARDNANGKSVEKSVNSLNTLLGSLNIKPAQKQGPSDPVLENTPFGVWIRRWEMQRPIPEPDPEMQDVDGVIKYILTWVYGHLAKMMNIKNAHSQLYDEAIAKLRVDKPEYDDEDDDSMLYDMFSDTDDYTNEEDGHAYADEESDDGGE